jgi:hypothetical protein
MEQEKMKSALLKNGVRINTTPSGMIFCTPDYTIIKLYPRFFDTLEIAYNHYKPYFKNN